MSTLPKTCFVIAPIGEQGSDIRKRSDDVMKAVIEPAARECGYEPVRADDIAIPGIINFQVIRHLIDDPLAVADLTGHNANVFYELAVRHAFDKPVITIIEEGQEIPFDVAIVRTVKLNSKDIGSAADCCKEVIDHIHAIENAPEKIYNPISTTLDLRTLFAGNLSERNIAEIRQILSFQQHSFDSRLDALTELAKKEFFKNVPGTIGQCKISFKMIMPLDPYTGADRIDLPPRDVVGYLPSNDLHGLAAGIYDLYVAAPGYPEELIVSGVTILRQSMKPHTDQCNKLHSDTIRLIRFGSIPIDPHYYFSKPESKCDCYCHK